MSAASASKCRPRNSVGGEKLPSRNSATDKSSIAAIMQDKAALASACEELAAFLMESAGAHERAALSGGVGFDLATTWQALPLLCALPSPDHMRLMAECLRAVVSRLEALPATVVELAGVLADDLASSALVETILGHSKGGNYD